MKNSAVEWTVKTVQKNERKPFLACLRVFGKRRGEGRKKPCRARCDSSEKLFKRRQCGAQKPSPPSAQTPLPGKVYPQPHPGSRLQVGDSAGFSSSASHPAAAVQRLRAQTRDPRVSRSAVS